MQTDRALVTLLKCHTAEPGITCDRLC